MAVLRILFTKVSDERHVMQIARADGRREQVECETRSYLMHDLLHYATEAEGALESGFWGCLAAGKTLEQMNARTGMDLGGQAPYMPDIEQVVGALSAVAKGAAPEDFVERLRDYVESKQDTVPAWVTTEFVARVKERMRRLTGRWKATPYGGTMELEWPPPQER